jgi:2-oxo-4-hydroxy-4-carboxy--5-ureidoimidazoline (OHCU) decarboxylase/GNAT superfamily N-acetyltransferase
VVERPPALTVRDFEPRDHDWARRLIGGQGGTHLVARLGQLVDPLTLPGLVAEADGRRISLVTIDETDRGMELVTVHSEVQGVGGATLLLRTALEVAVASDAARLWLLTTNDNVGAIRFYLRSGMRVVRVHPDAVTSDRATIKPEIPSVNPDNGLPIRDLIELELPTASAAELPARRFPIIDDLDALPSDSVAGLLRELFEDAPRFLARLADERPFGDDDGLVQRAHDLARWIPADEQVELLDAHPRIGADPDGVSALSYAEQGYGTAGDAGMSAWVGEELTALNEVYERTFGFRFVIFVAGRPRQEILAILERSLRDDREAELRRGVDDVVHIAADRLARLRSAS